MCTDLSMSIKLTILVPNFHLNIINMKGYAGISDTQELVSAGTIS